MEQRSSVQGQWRSLPPFLPPFPYQPLVLRLTGMEHCPHVNLSLSFMALKSPFPFTTEVVNALPQGEALGAVATSTPGPRPDSTP